MQIYVNGKRVGTATFSAGRYHANWKDAAGKRQLRHTKELSTAIQMLCEASDQPRPWKITTMDEAVADEVKSFCAEFEQAIKNETKEAQEDEEIQEYHSLDYENEGKHLSPEEAAEAAKESADLAARNVEAKKAILKRKAGK